MNTIWSKYIQGVGTLYYSRKLRFDDLFKDQYLPKFSLDPDRELKILEIGCGPGALAGALHRWYPNAAITAIDRDSEFIRFARAHEPRIHFMEGDATALPFDDGTFDVTISNTVSEHIEPSAFYGEQFRVLKPGGICLVLSSRRGIKVDADCMAESKEEEEFWKQVSERDDCMEKYAVCKYPMSEAEMPRAMTKYGFTDISTGYAAIDLTPDDPKYPPELVHAMIHANRQSNLDGVMNAVNSITGAFEDAEIERVKSIINAKYDLRLLQYERSEKQWDTILSLILILRGVKPLSF